MRILIKNVELNQTSQDILIEDHLITKIGKQLGNNVDKIIDGHRKAAVPGLVNGHTHSAMTLMRGYADDMPLMPWLEEKIWPLEAKLTEEDVYWGTRLACLEMIKTGTTCMVDMYFHFQEMARAVDEMGIRGLLTFAGFDFNQPHLTQTYQSKISELYQMMENYSGRIRFAMGPHAIYTVSTKMMEWIRDFARERGLKIHTHLSETALEVKNAQKQFGKRPVHYLESLGMLSPDLSLAHCLYLNEEEIRILGDHGCQVVHNPASNLKLVSGNHFPFDLMKKAGVTICIGTDGTCSSNNLDMYEAIKLAALTGKMAMQDPTIWSAEETFKLASEGAEKLTGFKTGKIEEGYLADISLIDLTRPEMTPNFNLYSNLVYSANGSVVDTVICDGKILMENRHVPGEEEIIEQANRRAHDLVSRK